MPVALPNSTPRALVEGHTQQEADIAESCDFEAGEPRCMPIYRSVPNVIELRWRMTQAQMTDFNDWFEDDLHAGHLVAELLVAEQGTIDAELVEALFLAPPEYRAMAGGRWMVSARVIAGVALESVGEIAAPGLSVGWSNPIKAGAGFVHANSGTGMWIRIPGATNFQQGGPTNLPKVGLIGYTSGAVVWVFNWAPTVADAAPGGAGAGSSVRIVGYSDVPAVFPQKAQSGLLTISATVDGVPTIDSVQMATGTGSYNTFAWGPTP